MESHAAAEGDDLQHPCGNDDLQQQPWVEATPPGQDDDLAEGDQDDLDSHLDVELSDDEVLEHSPKESRAKIEHLAKQVHRTADRLVWEVVQAEGFTGPHWRKLVDDLARYGLAVMDAWMRSGYVFAKVKEVGRPLAHTAAESQQLATDSDLRDELGAETVARALKRFRDAALIGAGWNPAGGASLTTYIVGGCVRGFSNEFRRWSRHEQRAGHTGRTATDPTELLGREQLADVERGPHMFADPARAAAGNDHLEQVLARLSETDRAIVRLTDFGYSQEEIGELVGLSARAVEGRLYRLRKSIGKGLGGDGH